MYYHSLPELDVNVQDVISSRIITYCKCGLYAGIEHLTTGTLYIVATPIGNLEDLSPRAKETLQNVDVIAAEDTRHTGLLLSKFGIKKRQIALHDHNEDKIATSLIDSLIRGMSVALVSDAGTPLISDPGFRLVALAHKSEIPVSPIPGPSAAIAAMSAAGLPSDRFAFEGFLPSRRDARASKLSSLKTDTRTLVFFESVHRVKETLHDLVSIFGGDRRAFIGREISKIHEQCKRATLSELSELLDRGDIVARGEFVIVVAGTTVANTDQNNIDADSLLKELVVILPGSQAVDIVTRLSGRKRNKVYKEMLLLAADRESD